MYAPKGSCIVQTSPRLVVVQPTDPASLRRVGTATGRGVARYLMTRVCRLSASSGPVSTTRSLPGRLNFLATPVSTRVLADHCRRSP